MIVHFLHEKVLVLASCAAALSPVAAAQTSSGEGAGWPLREWLEAGEVEELRWDIELAGPDLRMDQRLEVVIRGRIRGGALEPSGTGHELALSSWVRRAEGDEWIAESGPIRYAVEDGLPDADVEFDVQVLVTPGDYWFWILLVDETTGLHSLAIERVEVDEVDDEPFPEAYAAVPAVEFTDLDWLADEPETEASGELIMPVATDRPLDIEIIAALSAPERWDSFGDERQHSDSIRDAIVALSDLDVARGTISISGLDLVRRRRVFEQRNLERLDLEGLEDALEAANSGVVSVDDLAARAENPNFLRRFVEEQIAGRDTLDPERPLKVLLFVTGITRFDRDAEVEEIEFDGECACVAYHIRIRQHLRDLFDQVETIIDPLDPDTRTVLTPRDLRRAIGRIVGDLEQY